MVDFVQFLNGVDIEQYQLAQRVRPARQAIAFRTENGAH